MPLPKVMRPEMWALMCSTQLAGCGWWSGEDSHQSYERCYGVAAADEADGRDIPHGASSRARKPQNDCDPLAWVYVPAGECRKIIVGEQNGKPARGSPRPRKDYPDTCTPYRKPRLD